MGSAPTVTVMFKQFGVSLKFTPELTDDGTIHLKVRPEVSALDYTNAVTISGFLIPAISTRRADVQVALQDGQSFAIAGLEDDRVTNINSKVPVLGSIPLFGELFTSDSKNKTKTELLVLVTPHIVNPIPRAHRCRSGCGCIDGRIDRSLLRYSHPDSARRAEEFFHEKMCDKLQVQTDVASHGVHVAGKGNRAPLETRTSRVGAQASGNFPIAVNQVLMTELDNVDVHQPPVVQILGDDATRPTALPASSATPDREIASREKSSSAGALPFSAPCAGPDR